MLIQETDPVCKGLSSDPRQVTKFYEDNPTYQAPADPWEWPRATPESQGLSTALLRKGSAALEALPQALSFLVLRNGKLVYEQYLHGATKRASNNIHSASKSLLSLLVGIAFQQGFFKDPDAPIRDQLAPQFSFGKTQSRITLRQLLTMTAGLKWTEDVTEISIQKDRNWVQAILNLPQDTPPGETFNYSTGSTHTLSAVLTKATGMTTCAFARKNLFTPMGISFEHWGRDPQGFYSGGCNLYMTARQLLKLGQMVLQGGTWNGQRIVPADWIAQAVRTQSPVDKVYTYGYLFWLFSLNGHAVYKMWGYGGQYVLIVPDFQLVVVTTANTAQAYPEMDVNAFLAKYVLPSSSR